MEVNASFLLFLPFQYKIRREIMTNKQQELKEAEAKRKEESRIKQATEKAQNEIMGTYKRTVIDSYLKTYADNYGGTFDKNSLINSLSFSYKIDKYNNLSPDFTFNNNETFLSVTKDTFKEYSFSTPLLITVPFIFKDLSSHSKIILLSSRLYGSKLI